MRRLMATMVQETFDFHDHGHYTIKRIHSLLDFCKKYDMDGKEFILIISIDRFDARIPYFDVNLLGIIKHFSYHVRPVLRVLKFWRGIADCMEIRGYVKCMECGSSFPIDMLDLFHHEIGCTMHD